MRIIKLLTLLVLSALTACGTAQSQTQPTAIPPTQEALEDVTLQLSWIHNGVWSSFYIAAQDSFYAQEGLNVNFRTVFDADGNFLDVVEEVTTGRAQFGIASADVLLAARAAGQPVVAVATLYQRHPLALVSLSEKNITKPQDLVGATVQISPNSRLVFDAMLSSEGIDPADVNVVERTDFTTEPIVGGSADVLDAWVTNEVPILKLAEQSFNAVYPADYGIEMYPNVIFTSEDFILAQPDQVQGFVSASVRGMQAAIASPNHAAELALQYNPELNLEAEIEAAIQALPLIEPAGSQPGMMKPASWETAQEILLEEQLLSAPVDLAAAYNLSFLEAIYGELE